MQQKILVPLDGSEVSERVLPHVKQLTRAVDAKVHLLHVGSKGESAKTAARDYVDRIRGEQEQRFPSLDTTTLSGKPATVIVRFSLLQAFDMIAMTTQGRSGLGRLVYGSTAEEVLRISPVPLLLVRPRSEPSRCKTILVPLDGSHRSQSILPMAGDIASANGARLILFTVAPTELPASTASNNVVNAQEALNKRGVETELVVRRGKPVDEILKMAHSEAVDLIALSTHGRTGWERARMGSVAEEVLRNSPLPLLLQRTAGIMKKFRLPSRLISRGKLVEEPS